MFDLEQKISEWRAQMLAAGIKSPVSLDELEIHVREEFDRQMKSGSGKVSAFNAAAQKIGEGRRLAEEFHKIQRHHWSWRLAWAAWATFIISFFLPAISGTSDVRGYVCAMEVLPWNLDFHRAASEGWGSLLVVIHYTLLDPANLFMLISPMLLYLFRTRKKSLKRLHHSALIAFIIVSALLVEFGFSDWRIGFYLWIGSFGTFYLSMLMRLKELSASNFQNEQYV
jgi:hypothetical protein